MLILGSRQAGHLTEKVGFSHLNGSGKGPGSAAISTSGSITGSGRGRWDGASAGSTARCSRDGTVRGIRVTERGM
jgi:hypothetical protein